MPIKIFDARGDQHKSLEQQVNDWLRESHASVRQVSAAATQESGQRLAVVIWYDHADPKASLGVELSSRQEALDGVRNAALLTFVILTERLVDQNAISKADFSRSLALVAQWVESGERLSDKPFDIEFLREIAGIADGKPPPWLPTVIRGGKE